MSEGVDVSLKVGEVYKLKKAVFSASYDIGYAGMPSPDVYSVGVHWRAGNQAAAWNLYFNVGLKAFDFAGGRVTVKHVDPSSIRFRFDRI